MKDKLFWYVDSEGLYYTIPTSAVVNIPSPALETYILGNIQPVQRPLYQTAFNLWNHAPGSSRAVPVTNGNGLLQDRLGLMGCGELAANNVAAPGGGIFGKNVSCLDAWGSSGSNVNREWFNSDRVDWNIDANQRIFFRFKGDHGRQPSSTSLISPLFNAQSIQPIYEGQINHTYVVSGTMVNNFIFSRIMVRRDYWPGQHRQNVGRLSNVFQHSGAMPAPTLAESTIWARIGPATRLAAAWDKAN